MPETVALIITFVVCGALHDLAIMVVRGFVSFLFVPWFFLLGSVMLLGRAARLDLSNKPWLIRASVNLTYVGACLAVTLTARRFFAILQAP